MKKQILILIFIVYKTFGFSQNLDDIKFINCKVKKQHTEMHEILGVNKEVQVYKIRAKLKIQTRINGMFGTPTFKIRKKNYILYTIEDRDSIYRDSIYAEIKSYWKEQEDWSNKYRPSGDFSRLTILKSFFVSNEIVIPYVSTDHQRKEAYFIYWYNNRVYKFIFIGPSSGFGALSSFRYHSIKFIKNGKEIELKYVKNLAEAQKLINEK